jgi:hypothetical protein
MPADAGGFGGPHAIEVILQELQLLERGGVT